MSHSTGSDLERALADLESASYSKRMEAVRILIRLKDPVSVPALIAAMDDRDQYVARLAMKALGQIGDSQAVPALTEVALGDDVWNADVAVKALESIGDHNIVSDLLIVLRSERWRRELSVLDEPGQLLPRGRGLVALGEGLVNLAGDVYHLRARAARVLGQIQDPRAVPELVEVLEEEEDLFIVPPKEDVAWALEQIGTPEALAAVEKWRREQKEENQD